MKKIISMVVSLLIIFLFSQLIFTFFKTTHVAEYSVKSDKNSYIINETFDKRLDLQYGFKVTDKKNNKFIFSSENKFNKQKKVIKNIVSYRNNNLYCILPIYNNDDIGEIECLYDGVQVENSYLESIDYDTTKMISKMKKSGYKVVENKESLSKEFKMSNNSIMEVYEDNIGKDYTYAIWNYSGLFLINKERKEELKLYKTDLYDNSNSYVMGKYYFVFNFNSLGRLKKIDFVDLDTFEKEVINLEKTELHDKFYINGEYNNKIYLTDMVSKIQYSLNPIEKSFEVVGSDDSFYILKNNKLFEKNKRDFFEEKQYFSTKKVKEINNEFGDVEIKEYDNCFYFLKDDTFYKVYKDNLNHFIKLLKFDGVVDWKLNSGDIIFISNDTMYLFNRSEVLPIVKNSEFKFNYNNICNFKKK